MPLLTIVRDAWARLGIEDDLPSAVMSSSDLTVVTMRALATQEGRELAARAQWQRLVREWTFTTVSAQVQAAALPPDYASIIPGTVWNYTQTEPLLGPVTAPDWQMLSAQQVGPPDLHFRVRGNDFLILPIPPAGETIRFEYVSKQWVDANNDGIGDATAWVSDTDGTVLDEELLTLGLIWRWLKRNRLPYADEFAEYKTQVDQAIGRDGVKGTLYMGGRSSPALRAPGAPEGSWNL